MANSTKTSVELLRSYGIDYSNFISSSDHDTVTVIIENLQKEIQELENLIEERNEKD
jgi:hypothetical protein